MKIILDFIMLSYQRKLAFVFFSVLFVASSPVYAVYHVDLAELTSPEVRERVNSGVNIAIIPTGGTEQNGPHMIVGKHNKIIAYTASEIAKRLGNALVVPVIAYVPEGSIEPPEGHMQFAGTLSISEATFSALLEETAASLKQHGFTLICFVGDSGGNQQVQKILAEKLTAKWRDSGVRVVHVSDYYDRNGQDVWVKFKQLKGLGVAGHAGFEDTSELMAIDKDGVREHLKGERTEGDFKNTGATGDSTLASAEYGRYLLELKIQAAVTQIKHYVPKKQ